MATCRVAFIFFFVSLGFAIGNVFHGFAISRQLGNPNSDEAIEIRRVNNFLNLFAIIESVVGLIVLIWEFGNKLIAILYTFAMFTCILLASIVIVRTLIWDSFPKQQKVWDFRNASVDNIVNTGRLTEHLLFIQNAHSCKSFKISNVSSPPMASCGIEDVLEWQSARALNIQRRVPDACCTPSFRKRRCGEKALPDVTLRGQACGRQCTREFRAERELNISLPNIRAFDTADPIFRESIKMDLSAIGLDVCDVKWYNRVIYFHPPMNPNEVVVWAIELVCYELYYYIPDGSFTTLPPVVPNTNTTDFIYNATYNVTYDEFLLSQLRKIDRFYVDGCYEHMIEYTEKVVFTASSYAAILGILALVDIVIFYHYYWEFRVAQLAELPIPVWFEKLGAGDSAPVGIGRRTISLTEDPDEIAKDFRRRGILPYDDFEKKLKIPRRGRHPSVRIFPLQNREYPMLEVIHPHEPVATTRIEHIPPAVVHAESKN